MKFDIDDKNRCRLVCVKFHLNRCRFAAAVAKCLGAHFFGTQCSFNSRPTHDFEFRHQVSFYKQQHGGGDVSTKQRQR